MTTFEKIVSDFPALDENNEKAVEYYKNNFYTVLKEESYDNIRKALDENPDYNLYLTPLLMGSLNYNHEFKLVYEILSTFDFNNTRRDSDYFHGKMLRYYYQSLKYLGMNITNLYALLIRNKEYGNKYCVSVLINCILDFQINNQVYAPLYADIEDEEEKSRYCFYMGIIFLVEGEYKKALSYFDEAEILNKNGSIVLLLRKHMIVAKLLVSDFSIYYDYDENLIPYFSLIGAVKRGEVETFNNLLEEHIEEYFKSNLFYVLKRLIQNVIQEGLRKITVCYSRILVKDIDTILGVNVDLLLHKAISEGTVHGYVLDGIFYSHQTKRVFYRCNEKIRDVIETRKILKSRMSYPEIVPLSYEKIFDVAER